VPLALATLAGAEKRVMVYTMPGPQANRGKMARHYLLLLPLKHRDRSSQPMLQPNTTLY
jgi:hypothetical protein